MYTCGYLFGSSQQYGAAFIFFFFIHYTSTRVSIQKLFSLLYGYTFIIRTRVCVVLVDVTLDLHKVTKQHGISSTGSCINWLCFFGGSLYYLNPVVRKTSYSYTCTSIYSTVVRACLRLYVVTFH